MFVLLVRNLRFPVLKLPAWFPGMSFKTEMAHAKELTKRYVETAFEYSLERVVSFTYDIPFIYSVFHEAGLQHCAIHGTGWNKE